MNSDDTLRSLPASNVILHYWNILVVDLPGEDVQEIFIGYSAEHKLGRVSTPIEYFDINTGQGKTRSGSKYQTVGAPGVPHDFAIYTLEQLIGTAMVNKELFSDSKNSGKISFKYPAEQ